MSLDIVVAFFILGLVATLLGAKIDFPKGLYQTCVLFLLLAIGLKGGYALHQHAGENILVQSIAVILFGFLLPFVAYPLLRWFGGWSKTDAAATAAHYGSVSVGTYAVAVAILDVQNIAYEAYFPLFVALLEAPAIAIGIMLARQKGQCLNIKVLAHEIFFNQGVFLLLGGLVIGAWAGDRVQSVQPFFGTLFHGVLALFLLAMGQKAAEKLHDLKTQSAFLISFGIFMPLIGALAGALLGSMLELSLGGVVLMAVLGASASYIAVPAALSVSLPQANLSLALTASLAVTFPFNVIVGIPLYLSLAQHWFGG
ncbi:hypothetical protein SAMN02745127_00007 [Oceanospirillum multiglobuliferum]|uniref:Sodium-dependent bicarbonate transport family permease n=1 Tax=Oceanospirillum multiglobuliferum TaxID=64969 RepID=A0A1T4KB88_9GAMM|nr:sodium-dependent bicarbonate transport family permease [Oceanospirillum multiglobuliferum]OPX55970.1 sodium-dependent bicarbonate transport family permease [Oceanospirillum multiglobuliferum]SJZ39637.1 hypothetical protein SAMN02745127_00007 [Oceanospirillum multiglobuliferum]